MAMGNRETHVWWPFIMRKLRGARFPVLCSNLRGSHPPVLPCLVVEAAGSRVGLFALSPQMVTPSNPVVHFGSLIFDDPVESARRMIERLRPEVDLLACLSHLGRRFDEALPSLAPGIDLILGGHDHSPGMPEGLRVGTTFLAHSDPFGQTLGEVTITRQPDSRLDFRARLVELPG